MCLSFLGEKLTASRVSSSLILGDTLTTAEVGAPNPGLEACVELKTNKVIDSERADGVFHKKLLKHWAQSYLLGIPVCYIVDALLTSDCRSGLPH